ncbi:squalene synthetase [Uncinocarpus reesii 1704]|uniref:Squalene synthetase n=1 Tax=Uncinocarpus reesii (strain UAMH 1704) TaxID=336963 RepID=C4JMV6_UNCRE|nr:squalene synthetase [Uncinocarpus reesii 1704]EEP79318.1 squalene synthetase [Uncinocarpus reesii 1704]
MPSLRDAVYYLFHVQELRAIVQWMMLRKPVHPRDERKESRNVKECYRFLALTSRSFVAVCQELHPELLMPVVVFYLVLRSLDTIEDDMTIGIESKEPLLRNFYMHVGDEGWTFDGSGHRQENGQWHGRLRENGKRNANGLSVNTIKDYELYCHYVAGLVGEGLTRLFVQANFVDPALLTHKPELMESMGQLLQQTNIIRDIREDYDSKRYFWPKEAWSKYVQNFSDLFLPQNREKALQCSSEIVLMALTRAAQCLQYMAGVREQSTFNFVAIPQTMAIATLELCFQNPAVFDRNVKLSRGSACQIMLESTQDFQQVCKVFSRYATRIRRKNNPSDPHFLDIDITCGKIERFFEVNFPEEAKRKAQKAEARKGVIYMGVAMLGVIAAVMAGASWFQR